MLKPPVDVDIKAHRDRKLLQSGEPLHSIPGRFPGVGSHAEQSHNVLGAVQMNGEPKGDGFPPLKAGVFFPADGILIGAGI